MTTELDIARQDGHAEIVPGRPKAGTAAAAMNMLREQAEMMSMAYDLAKSMVGTSMVPKIYQPKNETDKEREKAAQNATAAILYGLELGLNPIQSLQQVFPVNNSPAIYARTMVALLKAKGYKFRTDEAGPERCTVSGWWPGDEPETSTWDIERATKAGYVPTIDPDTGKYKTKKFEGSNGKYEKLIGNEKYLTIPEDMLWAKAAATVCRRLAPDVLLGIGRTVEDLESEPEPEPVRVRSERVTVSAAEILGQADEPEAPKVQEWQPPAEDGAASDSSPKPEPEQVSEPTATTEEPAAKKPVRRKPKYTPGGISADMIEQIAMLLDNLGVTEPADKTDYLREFFKRPELVNVAELTTGEGKDLIGELMATLAAPIEHTGDQAANTEGGAQ
ncbi:hypothetical protein C5E45_32835 [Nocardia nova]|uniref:Recombinase RecT n=1 Tax=Nocardia nova TaxID=37330 RepID=A0A2S6ACQ6_9NOCA|nr:hypothetical protein [Nocardia nova]PPJ31878.1 hypothetical protein C5E45_32835 [Nocardia nova]